MDFLKKFMQNDKTVVGLCDLKRRTAINSFGFAYQNGYFSPSFNTVPQIPGGMLYTK